MWVPSKEILCSSGKEKSSTKGKKWIVSNVIPCIVAENTAKTKTKPGQLGFESPRGIP